jgi:hypothetical protein
MAKLQCTLLLASLPRMLVAGGTYQTTTYIGHQSAMTDRLCVPTAGEEELYHFCSVQQVVRFIKPGLGSSVLFVRKLMRIQPHGATREGLTGTISPEMDYVLQICKFSSVTYYFLPTVRSCFWIRKWSYMLL